jgi:hypothetical protein
MRWFGMMSVRRNEIWGSCDAVLGMMSVRRNEIWGSCDAVVRYDVGSQKRNLGVEAAAGLSP